MPCDQIVLCQVNIDAPNKGLLCRAIMSLGYEVNMMASGEVVFWHKDVPNQIMRINAGTASVPRGLEEVIDDVKRAYSKEVLKEASSKFGFRLEPGKKPNTFTMSKRF
jgi:hypothetical protein